MCVCDIRRIASACGEFVEMQNKFYVRIKQGHEAPVGVVQAGVLAALGAGAQVEQREGEQDNP